MKNFGTNDNLIGHGNFGTVRLDRSYTKRKSVQYKNDDV